MAATDDLSSQPFFHGTRAHLEVGDPIMPGRTSNFGTRKTSKYVYLTDTLDATIWGAELAVGDEPDRHGHRRHDLVERHRFVAAPGNVPLAAGAVGLSNDAVVVVSQVATLDKRHLTERVGRVDLTAQGRVDDGLRLALDLVRLMWTPLRSGAAHHPAERHVDVDVALVAGHRAEQRDRHTAGVQVGAGTAGVVLRDDQPHRAFVSVGERDVAAGKERDFGVHCFELTDDSSGEVLLHLRGDHGERRLTGRVVDGDRETELVSLATATETERQLVVADVEPLVDRPGEDERALDELAETRCGVPVRRVVG